MPETGLFISPGVDVGLNSPLLSQFAHMSRTDIRSRWTSSEGRRILQEWRDSGFDHDRAKELVGTFYGHLDLRGVILRNTDLTKRNLSRVDFFAADFSGAKLTQADLSDSYLSEADICGTSFDWAKMEGALLDNVSYDSRTSFLGVDLQKVNFTLAALLHDLAITQQRIAHLKKRNPLLAAFLRITSEYGLSLTRFFGWTVGVILLFAILYSIIPGALSKEGYWNAVYFSVVTFTTLGYGDVVPNSVVGQLLAMIEVATGYLMGGLLVAILARRLLLG